MEFYSKRKINNCYLFCGELYQTSSSSRSVVSYDGSSNISYINRSVFDLYSSTYNMIEI